MTANQLVAYNLKRARLRAGLSQEQAAELLEPYLGRRWSKATFSAAETSAGDGRAREFDADEILAFARAFNVPIGLFFLPPVEEEIREPVTSGGGEAADAGELLAVVAPLDVGAVAERIDELKQVLPESERRGYEGRIAQAALERYESVLAQQVIAEMRNRQPLTLAELLSTPTPTTAPSKEGNDG